MSKDLQHIIRLLKEKDKKAISILYDSYAATLNGVIVRIVQSEEIAQDVLQETFVKIWKNGPRYDSSKGTLFTWMLNIARNTAIDKTRSASFKNKGKIQALDKSVYNIKGTGINPDQIGLRNMLDSLDPKYKQIMELVYFQGYTQKEISDELDLPIGTIKSRVRIGLRELRKFFDGAQMILGFLFGCIFPF